jgi:hypothetical protein
LQISQSFLFHFVSVYAGIYLLGLKIFRHFWNFMKNLSKFNILSLYIYSRSFTIVTISVLFYSTRRSLLNDTSHNVLCIHVPELH